MLFEGYRGVLMTNCPIERLESVYLTLMFASMVGLG